MIDEWNASPSHVQISEVPGEGHWFTDIMNGTDMVVYHRCIFLLGIVTMLYVGILLAVSIGRSTSVPLFICCNVFRSVHMRCKRLTSNAATNEALSVRTRIQSVHYMFLLNTLQHGPYLCFTDVRIDMDSAGAQCPALLHHRRSTFRCIATSGHQCTFSVCVQLI